MPTGTTRQQLERTLAQRIMIIDGAMGTMIQHHQLTDADFRGQRFAQHPRDLAGNYDVLVLTRPDIIEDIHHRYLDAGADIIETNSFSSTSVAQAHYQCEPYVYEMNVEGARIARKAAGAWTMRTPDRPRFVAGAMGPTNRSLSLSPDVNRPAFRAITWDALVTAYVEQVRGLVDGGVDLLLVETAFDTLNLKAAVAAIQDVFAEKGVELPIMLSSTITNLSGRMLSGQTIDAFWIAVKHANPFSIGMNCALGARQIPPYLADLSAVATCYVSAYPNAGLPNASGAYDERPEETAQLHRELAQSGLVNIVGGCCGTTPDHIRAIVEAVEGITPRVPVVLPASVSERVTQFSGLETLTIRPDDNFRMIGERTGGVSILDVNTDESLLDPEQAMTTLLNLIATKPEVARLPIMVDSARWTVLEAGLKCLQGKGIVKSISLKDGEADFLAKARRIRRYGAGVVVMAFDAQGQADTIERTVSICQRAYALLVETAGYDATDIIFDLSNLPIATGLDEHNADAFDFIEATRLIRASCPGVHIMVVDGPGNVRIARWLSRTSAHPSG